MTTEIKAMVIVDRLLAKVHWTSRVLRFVEHLRPTLDKNCCQQLSESSCTGNVSIVHVIIETISPDNEVAFQPRCLLVVRGSPSYTINASCRYMSKATKVACQRMNLSNSAVFLIVAVKTGLKLVTGRQRWVGPLSPSRTMGTYIYTRTYSTTPDI